MTVRYICRYCRMKLGEIDGSAADESRLGLHSLTPEERDDIITYDSKGGMVINLICDYCREALEHHPELSLVPSPLQ